MQEKCKLKIKAIPAVDARPTKEGSKPAQHNFDVEAASPGCRLGLGRWFAFPKGPIGVEGERGGESLFGWPLAWEFPVPLPTGRANCRGWSLMFPLVPTPPTPISQGESVPFRPPKVHTHTHSPVQAHNGQTLRQRGDDSTTPVGWFQSKGPALWAALWHVDLWRPPTHGLVMDVAHSSHSQPDSDEHGNGLGEVGRWRGGRGKSGVKHEASAVLVVSMG